MVAFSTVLGDVAADGEGLSNSPSKTALLNHLPHKGVEINTVMTRVKAEVAEMTKNHQRPCANGDLTTEVYLAPANRIQRLSELNTRFSEQYIYGVH